MFGVIGTRGAHFKGVHKVGKERANREKGDKKRSLTCGPPARVCRVSV